MDPIQERRELETILCSHFNFLILQPFRDSLVFIHLYLGLSKISPGEEFLVKAFWRLLNEFVVLAIVLTVPMQSRVLLYFVWWILNGRCGIGIGEIFNRDKLEEDVR